MVVVHSDGCEGRNRGYLGGVEMEKIVSCGFNMDSACVELRFADGRVAAIDTTAVENEVADTVRQCSELDWLVYNKSMEYA